MLKTDANPNGTPIEAFNAIRAGVLGDRSQSYQDLSEPLYGANRPGASVSQGCGTASGGGACRSASRAPMTVSRRSQRPT
jgi:hypothetical protein